MAIRLFQELKRRTPAGWPDRITASGIAMLVLTRRIGEDLIIAGHIRLTILGIDRNQVRLGVVAPQ